ncbi:Uncharacterised protein [Leminorella richardii]|uniref:Uncharacterized protein n=1 Tax=Leminorella richardii TaxID=158841 RepID=A0A2X4USW2_9GAMM|nr:Uncharacterised protein [Leminorella richardii]
MKIIRGIDFPHNYEAISYTFIFPIRYYIF